MVICLFIPDDESTNEITGSVVLFRRHCHTPDDKIQRNENESEEKRSSTESEADLSARTEVHSA